MCVSASLHERDFIMNLLTESFKQKYDQFLTGCDAIEQAGGWDTEQYGEMETFYTNDLISLMLRLVATDGCVAQREADVLNDLFGFTYTAETLAETYEVCRENMNADFDRLFAEGVDRLEGINQKLAQAYKELLVLICDIIMESDDVVSDKELAEAARMKTLWE